jgi:methylglutaconyl-CoA hydratase
MDTVDLRVDARGVAWLTLNRPDKHNAMSGQMIDEITATAARLGRDPAVRVVVLGANGPSFCAGGDLGWMRDQMQADAATRAREASKLADMLGTLDRMPKPLIGRIHGRQIWPDGNETWSDPGNHRALCGGPDGGCARAACIYVCAHF